MKHNVEEYRVS